MNMFIRQSMTYVQSAIGLGVFTQELEMIPQYMLAVVLNGKIL